MGCLKSLAKGFLVATGLIWVFNVPSLILGGDPWLGLMYLLILFIPLSGIAILKAKTIRVTPHTDSKKWRNLLFSFQGVALGFWMFDIATTFYAINVTGLAIELNPLGWPWGILGALAFFGPSVVFSYFLLFRLREKVSLYAAFPLTLITLGMGMMNLVAGAQNFQVFVDTAALASGLRIEFLGLLVAMNLAVPLALNQMIVQPKPSVNLKKP
jgi:drug/metabolite transporter (DMT)-like permease